MERCWKRLKNAIYQHYQDTTFVRSERQLELEKWLIPRVIPFNRYMLVPEQILHSSALIVSIISIICSFFLYSMNIHGVLAL